MVTCWGHIWHTMDNVGSPLYHPGFVSHCRVAKDWCHTLWHCHCGKTACSTAHVDITHKPMRVITLGQRCCFRCTMLQHAVAAPNCHNTTSGHRSGCIMDPLNYRQVSLTSSLCKMCEEVIKVKWSEYLES